jgi:chemotaxis protein MotA
MNQTLTTDSLAKQGKQRISKNVITRIGISIGGARVLWLFFLVLANLFSNQAALYRVFVLLGGSSQGYIQFICYAMSIYAILQLSEMNQYIKEQFKGFDLKILPEEDQLILTSEEVADIKLSVIEIEKRGMVYLVTRFIKNGCTQYRNNQSIPETMQVLDGQIGNAKEEMEGNLNMVRFLISSVMSVGFIGTIIGLTSAIGNAHLAKSEHGLSILTSYLAVSFDTTLVALLLGLILNYFYQRYLERIDVFFAQSKSYIMDNLVSRIYTLPGN